MFGIIELFREIVFLWKFLLIVVLSGWIFTRVGSKLLATAMVCFVFWMVLTNNFIALVVTGLYLLISYAIPHGFEMMTLIQDPLAVYQEYQGYEKARKQMRSKKAMLQAQYGSELMKQMYGVE